MKTSFKFLFACCALFSVLLFSCSKDDDKIDDEPTPTDQNNLINNRFVDATGVLSAIKVINSQDVMGTLVEVELNTAVASFFAKSKSDGFVSAGSITINGNSMTQFDNKAYAYDNTNGILDFTTVSWAATGQGRISGFVKPVTQGFPKYTKFASLPETFSLSSNLTLPMASAFTNADSVVVIITGSKNAVSKVIKPGNSDVAFSSSEISAIGTGAQGMISITPYNMSYETMAGNRIYFVNQSNYTKSGVKITQ